MRRARVRRRMTSSTVGLRTRPRRFRARRLLRSCPAVARAWRSRAPQQAPRALSEFGRLVGFACAPARAMSDVTGQHGSSVREAGRGLRARGSWPGSRSSLCASARSRSFLPARRPTARGSARHVRRSRRHSSVWLTCRDQRRTYLQPVAVFVSASSGVEVHRIGPIARRGHLRSRTTLRRRWRRPAPTSLPPAAPQTVRPRRPPTPRRPRAVASRAARRRAQVAAASGAAHRPAAHSKRAPVPPVRYR